MENSYLNETINLIEDNNANNLCLEQKENDLKREIYENNRLKGNLSTYSNNIFFNAALPLVKVIANDVPSLKKQFEKVHAIIQVSALDEEAEGGKIGMHYVVNGDEWLVHLNAVDPNPHVELEFKSVEAMNAFFKGKMSPATLPKMKGIVKQKLTACVLAAALVVGMVPAASAASSAVSGVR